MIVSEAEIRKVLELTRPGQTDDPLPPVDQAGACTDAPPTAPDPNVRLARLLRLRDTLRSGTYYLEPDSVAEKMIGRAIVDQIAQLVDKADDRD